MWRDHDQLQFLKYTESNPANIIVEIVIWLNFDIAEKESSLHCQLGW